MDQAMIDQLNLSPDMEATKPTRLPISVAIASLRELLHGNDEPEGEIDRRALLMAIKALSVLQETRRWVWEFGKDYTALELADMADSVEGE